MIGPLPSVTDTPKTPVSILDADLAALRRVRALADRYGEYGGLIEMARRAVGLNRSAITSHLGVSQQAFYRLTQRSATNPDTLKFGTLRRVAEALGCEAVIVFVPKSAESFAALAARVRPRRSYLSSRD